MKIEEKLFGQLNGNDVFQYILTNDQGMVVKIMTYGATITSIQVPASSNSELVSGFDSFEEYLSETYLAEYPYFGCTVGRFANRVKDGKFTVDNEQYQVAVNNGTNHLHGGLNAFDKKIWRAERIEGETSVGVKMTAQELHLAEGFPGNIEITVTFELNNQSELSIRYHGVTDQKTPMSLTNHSYFSLNGFQRDIGDHMAWIDADNHLELDESGCPNGRKIQGQGAMDFSKSKELSEAFESLPEGLDNYYIFNKQEGSYAKVAEVSHPNGRKIELFSDEPGMQVYTAFFTSDKLSRENGDQYGPLKAFCLETHKYPNGVNIEDAPQVFVEPDKPYMSRTVLKFSW